MEELKRVLVGHEKEKEKLSDGLVEAFAANEAWVAETKENMEMASYDAEEFIRMRGDPLLFSSRPHWIAFQAMGVVFNEAPFGGIEGPVPVGDDASARTLVEGFRESALLRAPEFVHGQVYENDDGDCVKDKDPGQSLTLTLSLPSP